MLIKLTVTNQQKRMSADGSEYESEMESEEEGASVKAPKARFCQASHKETSFYPVGKIAAVINIQRNIEVGHLRIQSACRVANLHYKQFITWERDIIVVKSKRNKKAESMCIGPSTNLHLFKEPLLCYIFEL